VFDTSVNILAITIMIMSMIILSTWVVHLRCGGSATKLDFKIWNHKTKTSVTPEIHCTGKSLSLEWYFFSKSLSRSHIITVKKKEMLITMLIVMVTVITIRTTLGPSASTAQPTLPEEKHTHTLKHEELPSISELISHFVPVIWFHEKFG
jgi:hypothetical protein